MRTWVAALTACLVVAAGSVVATPVQALPIAPDPVVSVTGIPTPCRSTAPYPADASIGQLKEQLAATFGVKLAGSQWTEQRRPSIKILWETLDAVECTPFRKDLQANVSGTLGINAASISGFAWGDWSLTKTNHVTLDFAKFQRALDSGDEGRLVRLVIHELGHVRNSNRYERPEYWTVFTALHAREGRFSRYAGRSVTETFADVVGYYVGRCALDNPYDSGEHAAYYDYAKTYIFGGKEFGPPPGVAPNCTLPSETAEEPVPGAEVAAWMEGLGGE